MAQPLPVYPVKFLAIKNVDATKSEIEIKNFVRDILNLNEKRFALISVDNQKPQGQNSYRFQLLLDQIPLQNGLVFVSPRAGGKLLISVPDIDFQHVDAFDLPDFSIQLATGQSWVLVYNEGRWKTFRKVENHQTFPKTISQTEYYDQNGRLIFLENWLLNYHLAPDSTIKASVFRPDPSTKLKRPYGQGISDRQDSNSVLLTAALDTIQLLVKFENDTFQLKNNWFRMGEFSLPKKALARLTTNNYCFTRDSAYFEEVNVFYHLNLFRSFIDSIGFSNLANYQLKVDAHGMDGLDQSAYSPGLDILSYGIGNVDDGEDANVIVHEYGHVLTHSALPFGNSGMERKSVEEGICDYLAGSYSKSINQWEWQKLFKWDGWNEFWSGRNLLSTKHYPENLVGQIHRDGEIFSSALMNIELLIGRAITHKILMTSFSTLVPNLTMPQAAFLFLEADSLINNGIHTPSILAVFFSKGISPGNVIVSTSEQITKYSSGSNWIRNLGGNLFEIQQNEEEIQQVDIVDLNGRIVLNLGASVLQSGRLNLENIGPGYYFLVLKTNQEVRRISIQVAR